MNIFNLIGRITFKLTKIFLKEKIDFYYYDEVDQNYDFNDYIKNYDEGLKVTNSFNISSFDTMQLFIFLIINISFFVYYRNSNK